MSKSNDSSPNRHMHLFGAHLAMLLSAAVLLLSAGTADAQVHRAVIRTFRPPDLPGYCTCDIFIDFSGQYTGSQMIVELTTGEIYQELTLGRFQHLPPTPALFPIFPNLQWDTFLANGGPTAQDSVGNFGLGGAAINIDPEFRGRGPGRAATFSDELIDQSWNPAGGNIIEDQEDFMVARVTFSDDTNGTLTYLASANQVIGVPELAIPGGLLFRGGERGVTIPIVNGIGFFGCIPEPSTVVLLGIGLAAIAMLNSGRGRRRGRESGGWGT